MNTLLLLYYISIYVKAPYCNCYYQLYICTSHIAFPHFSIIINVEIELNYLQKMQLMIIVIFYKNIFDSIFLTQFPLMFFVYVKYKYLHNMLHYKRSQCKFIYAIIFIIYNICMIYTHLFQTPAFENRLFK